MSKKKSSQSNRVYKWSSYLILIMALSPIALIFFFKDKDGRGIGDLWEARGFKVFFFTALFLIGIIIYRTVRHKEAEKKWSSGVFKDNQVFSEDTLLQAYIRLGALMLRQDTVDLKGKLGYLHKYFSEHFENSYQADLSVSLNGAFHNPIRLNDVTPWLKQNLRSQSQRSQLVYFLVGLSAVDGSINPREKRFLEQVAHELDISRKDFESIMAMYTRYEDAFNNQNKQQQQRRTATKPRSNYQKEKAAKVLGVALNASTDEIKKAYRSLAKVHHPDKFAGQSEAQQKIAEERFIKIQQAYEVLLEGKN